MAALPDQQDTYADTEEVVVLELRLSQNFFVPSSSVASQVINITDSKVEQRKIALKCSLRRKGLASNFLNCR